MHKINNISPDSHEYLQILESIADTPEILYYMGKLPSQRRPTLAIVGTRKPTSYGTEVTRQFAGELARRGIIIVSGLALGVDALAHQAALDARGTTLAVLASGLPDITPRANRHLGERILCEGGAILSEYDSDHIVNRVDFLRRNRIVSGLSDAVLITEASSRSGTLNTAAHALAQGREVFVIPGNITSPLSAGTNTLIRQGATPVTCVEDILSILAPSTRSTQTQIPLGSTPLESDILRLIAEGIRDGDLIQRQLSATPGDFSTALTMLEIAGSIRSLGANQWTLR